MRRVTTIAEMRAAVAGARRDDRRVGLVPTMGALHEGHVSLVRVARRSSDFVVVSIFVNPLQFGPGEDLAAYPRDLARDEAALVDLDEAAPDLVFAPDVAEVYPRPIGTTVSVGALTEGLCGARRPGHFDGVTTVVAKLFNLVLPDVAFFGRKDFQQLQVIRRMAADLDIPIQIVGVPTVREPDGVAMSSRNAYLDADERRAARALSRGLAGAVTRARSDRDRGRRTPPDVLRDAVLGTLGAEPTVRPDYVEVVDPDTLQPPDTSGEAAADGADHEGPLLVAVAAHVGRARLIDNVVIGDEEDENRLLGATSG